MVVKMKVMNINKPCRKLKIIFQKSNALLELNSPVFISVSGHRSNNDDRYFLKLSKSEWINILQDNNFKVVKTSENKDLIGSKINWYSFFLKTNAI